MLERHRSVDTEPLPLSADLSGLRALVADLPEGEGRTGERVSWDGEVAQALHQAIGCLPNRVAGDMRFWQWLCVMEFPNWVWKRWHGPVPDSPRDALGRAMTERFLGSPSLRGISRNALARLWWCADTLRGPDGSYDLAKRVLMKQDLFQAIFEREFGLYAPAARACALEFEGRSQDEWRAGTQRLNHLLTTIAVEALDEHEIRALLQ